MTIDVIVYQMGKVASGSIQDALKSAGLQAAHSHFLGEAALIKAMKALADPRRAHPDFVTHATGQLLQNIETTRLVNWYKLHKTKEGHKLKVITLARDPISWCRANFLQNFDMYFHRIRTWGRANLPDLEASPKTHLGPFFQSVFDALPDLEEPLDSPDIGRAIRTLKLTSKHPGVVHEHLQALARPLAWFDSELKAALAIDIYSEAFEADKGIQIYENEFCEVLLIKFEALSDARSKIGAFVGLDDLPMQRKNVSDDKAHSVEVAAAFDGLATTPQMLSRIYDCRYCQFFGYSPS